MPVTWEEVEQGFQIEDFRMENAPSRIANVGDLWKPLLTARPRVDLTPLVND
jgi:bifunctional non-homologous end joining protein LigD